jgi:hypothetical protein
MVDLYLIALFGHIVGALFLFALLGIETIGLARLRTASSVEGAFAWMGLAGIMRKGGPIALVVILIPGLWMAADRWKFPAWTMVALASMIALAVIGMVVTGAAMRGLGPRLGKAQGIWSPDLAQAVLDPMLLRSLALRLGIALGIIALMVFKPDMVVSLIVVIAGAVIGLIWSMVVARDGARVR